MLFMIEKASKLIAESEEIRQDYEGWKGRLQPDQRNIIEFRHSFLDLVLRIYEPLLSSLRLSECENFTKIEANIRSMFHLRGASNESFKIWKCSVRTSLDYAIHGVILLKRLPKLTDDQRKLMEELEEWIKVENRNWDPHLSEEVLAKMLSSS